MGLSYVTLCGSGGCLVHFWGYPIRLPKVNFTEFTVWASLVTQTVKNPPALRETWIRSPGWEDPLGKGMATHSSIPA